MLFSLREKKRSISSNGGNVGHDEGDSSLFFHKSKKAESGDRNNTLEHSSNIFKTTEGSAGVITSE